MKKELFEKKIIKGMFPFVFAAVLISVSFQACQKDEILPEVNSGTAAVQANQLKSATFSTSDIDLLIVKIENYLNEGNLEPGLANAFTVKLENAKKSLEKGNEKASINQLQALINQLKGLVTDGTIETSIGEGLIYELRLLAGETPTFTDTRDNHEYKTIKIGEQVWMAENLAYLPEISNGTGSRTIACYYVYDYFGTDAEEAKSTTNYTIYGVLYNWPAALTACPDGWHLPSDVEWQQLSDYLIENGYGCEGSGNDIAKALAATTGWREDYSQIGTPGNDILSNNSSGFSGLPGGNRSIYGYFISIGLNGYWWSSTEDNSDTAWDQRLSIYSSGVFRSANYKDFGFSVRCVRD